MLAEAATAAHSVAGVLRLLGVRLNRASPHHQTVVGYALARPEPGPRKPAEFIRQATDGTCALSHGSVSNILHRTGLSTVSARRSKL
ncbi:hypothetical protein [Micromonospora matsumotoense]|uniref:hypothetical protein n=1 Tax=Micromonospora matsumotoense TaxID=121616 RepID=UPI00114CA240|nr:hypothetical protein [Micromonospora matsumotoense]